MLLYIREYSVRGENNEHMIHRIHDEITDVDKRKEHRVHDKISGVEGGTGRTPASQRQSLFQRGSTSTRGA